MWRRGDGRTSLCGSGSVLRRDLHRCHHLRQRLPPSPVACLLAGHGQRALDAKQLRWVRVRVPGQRSVILCMDLDLVHYCAQRLGCVWDRCPLEVGLALASLAGAGSSSNSNGPGSIAHASGDAGAVSGLDHVWSNSGLVGVSSTVRPGLREAGIQFRLPGSLPDGTAGSPRKVRGLERDGLPNHGPGFALTIAPTGDVAGWPFNLVPVMAK